LLAEEIDQGLEFRACDAPLDQAGAQNSQSPVDAEKDGDWISRFPLRPEVDFRNINSANQAGFLPMGLTPSVDGRPNLSVLFLSPVISPSPSVPSASA